MSLDWPGHANCHGSGAGWTTGASFTPLWGVIELDRHSLFGEDGSRRPLWFTAAADTHGAAQPEPWILLESQCVRAGPV